MGAELSSKYQYKAMAFDGERSFSGLGEGDTRICSVLACTGDTIDTSVTCDILVILYSKYQYKAITFDGERNFSGLGEGDTRICSVLTCTGDTIDTCGKRFPTFVVNSTSIFEELTIVATVPTPVLDTRLDAHDSSFFPISLDVSIMPLEPSEYTYTEVPGDGTTVFTYTLVNTEKELYSFAVWGRVFEPAPGSSIVPFLSKSLLVIVLALLYV
ncbi:vanin-like protein 1 [Cydia amplana]|uniref:vanin-like protein 1 n=1 Tax=Cydia amplana TaxID=1869771 RepID=UPI002FE5AACE